MQEYPRNLCWELGPTFCSTQVPSSTSIMCFHVGIHVMLGTRDLRPMWYSPKPTWGNLHCWLCHDPNNILCIWRQNHRTWRRNHTTFFFLHDKIGNGRLQVGTSLAMDVIQCRKNWLTHILIWFFLATLLTYFLFELTKVVCARVPHKSWIGIVWCNGDRMASNNA